MTRIGIDASNLRGGGGITHLRELLRAAVPAEQGIGEVVVWGGEATLRHLAPQPWLTLVREPALDDGPLARFQWQRRRLQVEAARRCDLLFVPGGSYPGRFTPFVTMCRNMLPFEPAERARYGQSWMRLRLTLLERTQISTFRRAAGLIFLTETARTIVGRRAAPLTARTTVIPHGVAAEFRREPSVQRPISSYSNSSPFRWLYVSIVDVYKHQVEVVEAVAALRRGGMPIALDLVGSAYPPALRRLQAVLTRSDPSGSFIQYHGDVPYTELPAQYHRADGCVFASSCENMPNILIESMAAGLPIACSNRGVMPEILGDAGVYFDPEQPESIERSMRELLESPKRRAECAARAAERALAYSWERCRRDTFQFLAEVAGGVPGRGTA